jgi:hypothetical protein
MSGTEKSHAALLDELAALDPPQRREVAAALQSVAETFAGGARRSAHRPHTRAAGPLDRPVVTQLRIRTAKLAIGPRLAIPWNRRDLVVGI